jgi:hypothetical protein
VLVSGGVVRDRFWCIVHRAIQLDDESKGGTKEVDDESIDDVLPSEVEPVDAISPQESPGEFFCGRSGPSQFNRTAALLWRTCPEPHESFAHSTTVSCCELTA